MKKVVRIIIDVDRGAIFSVSTDTDGIDLTAVVRNCDLATIREVSVSRLDSDTVDELIELAKEINVSWWDVVKQMDGKSEAR